MNYWALKKRAIMGAAQSGKLTEAEGYPLILENSKGEKLKDYRIWGNDDGLGASGTIDVVTSGKNLLKATDFYSVCGGNYSELVEDGRNCVRFTDNIGRKYEGLTFKENTQYTISFDCKATIKSTDNNSGSAVFRFFYDDNSTSYIYVPQNTDWAHRMLTSDANKTVIAIGLTSFNYTNWGYIDIDTFQLEEGAEATEYEPYQEPTTTTIDLTGHNSIMSNDYVDFRNGCIVRSDGTEEEIYLPKIPTVKGYNIITASDAELEATNMYGKYIKKG